MLPLRGQRFASRDIWQAHIKVPYLLLTDTADEPITMYHGVRQLLGSDTLKHWWAVDNEVAGQGKLEGLPLGVMDALELGVTNQPSSVTFHANVSEYITTLLSAASQVKSKWLMMQMTETHPERRKVRQAITAERWGEGEVRKLTPDRTASSVALEEAAWHALMVLGSLCCVRRCG